MDRSRKVGILTGGGDCPGLNAVIRGAVESVSYTHLTLPTICSV